MQKIAGILHLLAEKDQKNSPFLQFFVGHFPSRRFYRLWLRFYWHFHFLVRFGSASGLAKSSNPTGKITLFGRRPTLSRTKMSKSCKKYNIFCIFDDLLVRPDDHLAQQKQYIFVGDGPSWDSKSQNIARNTAFFHVWWPPILARWPFGTAKTIHFRRWWPFLRLEKSKYCKKYNTFLIFGGLPYLPDDHLAKQKQCIFVGRRQYWDTKSKNIARKTRIFGDSDVLMAIIPKEKLYIFVLLGSSDLCLF